MKMSLCATGVVPARVYPQPGRISALAGRQGRLRACMKDVQRFFLPHFFSGPELSTAESWGPLWGSDSVVDNCIENTLCAG
ncbi:hypothetical protein GAU27_21905 [Salmonella enterica]|nr:hypothetical protein [Salmonella enterica]EDC6066069.1 hypothetical protein [Salmonella enterica]